MGAQLLYSTNTFLKHLICENFRGGVHYVWCSETFDSAKASPYSMGSLVPPSANPADIYRELARDVTAGDMHSHKISAQKLVLSRLAVDWDGTGEITSEQAAEILEMVKIAPFNYWRPLIYIIPLGKLASKRIKSVPVANRAGFGKEYVITDLMTSEFEIIDFGL